MKNIYLCILLLLISTISAYSQLRVADPRQWSGQSGRGKIDTATLTIKPHGAYFEYGLYLTISGGEMSTYYDTTEIILDFTLPTGSMIEDSWLWVGNDIVQADLIERNTANNIYEGIVQRRQDPSILFKNSNTNYQIRIFPLPPGQSRKIKISYLVPVTIGGYRISAQLPINILQTSNTVPNLNVLAYVNSEYSNPRVKEINASIFSMPSGNQPSRAVITSSQMLGNSQLSYSVDCPFDRGVFLSVYPTSVNSGYYQLLTSAQALLDTGNTSIGMQKTVFILDYEKLTSDMSIIEALNQIKNILHSYYSATDSFNLMYARSSLTAMSDKWLPCTYSTIESISSVEFSNPNLSYTNLPLTLSGAVQFIKNNGSQGNIFLMANSNNHVNSIVANQLASAIHTEMLPHNFKIDILGYTNQKTSTQYGNTILYNKLSQLTNGIFQAIRTSSTVSQSLSNAVYYIFNPTQSSNFIQSFDMYLDFTNGFTYSNYITNPNTSTGTAVRIGKYYGTLPLEIELTGVVNNITTEREIYYSTVTHTDSFNKKIWAGKWLNELENSSPSITAQRAAVDSSIKYRVLSRYTAFLALEPSDTISICSVCLDPTNPGGPATGINENITELGEMKAMPNPFKDIVTIRIKLSPQTSSPVLKIYNLMGQVVKQFEIGDTDSEFTLIWDGDDNTGQAVSAGMYILTLETESSKKTIRLLKQ